MMDTDKAVEKYSRNFQTVLVKGNFQDIPKHLAAYRTKLSEMYASESFRKHNIYPQQIRRTSTLSSQCVWN